MTQEEKAKAYDRVAKEVKDFFEGRQKIYSDINQTLEYLFPELKESEDEKIRKFLIKWIQDNYYHGTTEIPTKTIIAWLEKQEGCEHIKKDWLEHIKQSWYKEGFIDGKYTPKELTTNDATTLNELIDFLENGTAKLQHDVTLYANWLKTHFSPNEKQGEQKPFDYENATIQQKDFAPKVEPKFKVKYAGSEYNVFETKDIAGVTFYGIEDEPNHIDYVKADNCEIIGVYVIKENGSPYPTKPAVFSEKKSKRMISAEAKEAMYDKPACAWSEKDENVLEDIKEAIINYWGGDTQDILLDWLKSLKQRIGWKPSDEQMDALWNKISNDNLPNSEKEISQQVALTELYEQLKKLKGE